MGLFNAILGNASEVSIEAITKEFEPIIVPGENIEKAFKLVKDMFIFTNKRLILVEKQLVGSKTGYTSIPYANVIKFSKESAGILDLDAELKIWISGSATPFQKQFNKKLSIYDVQSVLASYVLK